MIQITSLMSEAADPGIAALAAALGKQVGQQVRYDIDLPYPERFARLKSGEIQAGWVCGIVYVSNPDLVLLAAPVMLGHRYAGRPVYFSDLVVRRASPYRTFADLKGARFTCNEPGSFSGDLAMRAALLERRADPSFFGAWLDSGGHTRSIAMMLDGTADAAAIDSTVLDQLAYADPLPLEQLQVLESFGPYPMPPWVASNTVPADLQSRLRAAILAMHLTEGGRQALPIGQIVRFEAVDDRFYDPIRKAAQVVSDSAPT